MLHFGLPFIKGVSLLLLPWPKPCSLYYFLSISNILIVINQSLKNTVNNLLRIITNNTVLISLDFFTREPAHTRLTTLMSIDPRLPDCPPWWNGNWSIKHLPWMSRELTWTLICCSFSCFFFSSFFPVDHIPVWISVTLINLVAF